MASTTVRIIYDRVDIRRLIVDDLKRRGFDQAASQAENEPSDMSWGNIIMLGHDHGDRDRISRRVVIDEVQVRDWIEYPQIVDNSGLSTEKTPSQNEISAGPSGG